MNHEETPKNTPISQHTKLLVSLASYASVVVAAILILAKFFAWMRSDSLSLQASLIDSLLDITASVINLLVLRQALKPADKEHRFGHGKAEALGGLGQSAFIAGSAVWIIIDAIHRLIYPHPLQESLTGSIVMILAIVLTLLLVIYQRYVINQTRSLAISADSLHYLGDLYTNIGVLISLNVSFLFGWTRLDPLVGAGIAGYILYTSWVIGQKSLDVLMDRELPDEERLRITEIVLQNPLVWGIHDLRTRSAGLQDFIQMHLDMDEKMSLLEAHDVANDVELALQKAFPHAEIIIHQDPLPNREAVSL
ncbi:MAG: cation diffusion facilitator family transporter [Alphaproteobacteria bacterium]|nr:cation diffusion facilitator family transporter [Alphaproteobacteria bacterium]